MRTFIAIELDDELKTQVFHLISRLDSGKRNVKWIKEQGMHITLKFLGEISEKKKEDVARLLQQVTKNHQSFPLNFRGTGTFPHGSRNPRVLWIGIDKSGPLEALQAETEAKLKDLGFPVENRTFRPHLTLGRVKKRFHLEPLLSKLKRYQDEFFGEMTVQKITFFRSTLKPSGAEYTRLAEFTLE